MGNKRTKDTKLSPGQVADRLQVSHSYVCRLVKRGLFPNAIRVGAHIRIPESDVDAYEEEQRIHPRTGGREAS